MSEIPNKSEEQKVAEAEVEGFKKDLGPFVVAAETTRMAMVFTDPKEPGNPIIFANDSFLSLSGYERTEVLGQSLNFLMAAGGDSQAIKQIEAASVRRDRSAIASAGPSSPSSKTAPSWTPSATQSS